MRRTERHRQSKSKKDTIKVSLVELNTKQIFLVMLGNDCKTTLLWKVLVISFAEFPSNQLLPVSGASCNCVPYYHHLFSFKSF